MVRPEIKKKLINKIRDIDNPQVINEIYQLLEIDLEEDVYPTTTDQKKAIKAALSQVKEGETISEEEANKQIEEWLNKES